MVKRRKDDAGEGQHEVGMEAEAEGRGGAEEWEESEGGVLSRARALPPDGGGGALPVGDYD